MKPLLAIRLKKLRFHNNCSQADVATAIGCTMQAISNYESGKRTPGVPELIALADFFEVSIDYLVGRTNI